MTLRPSGHPGPADRLSRFYGRLLLINLAVGAGGRPTSAGERQRLGLARTLLSDAPLLLLDEPTSHLDPSASGGALENLFAAPEGCSVRVVSHDPEIGRHSRTRSRSRVGASPVAAPSCDR